MAGPRHWTNRVCLHSIHASSLLAAAFAVPAAFAGYHVVHGKSQVGASSLLSHDIFAWIGAMAIGGVAWT